VNPFLTGLPIKKNGRPPALGAEGGLIEQHRAFVTLPAACWVLAGSALAPTASNGSGDDSQPKIGPSTVVQ
jgi:hypothetical protein